MRRRIRTGPLTLNGYGHYVTYMAFHRDGRPVYVALYITAGPSVGVWKFDL